MKHDWRQVTLVQTPPRYQCVTCGATRRWSTTWEAWTYYRLGVGFVGRRSPRCAPRVETVPGAGEEKS